ncbi:dTDP-4-dehydrorhamnose 3,5-epimerase [Rhodoferax sp. WC2427]|uniref:dTDP-4-dehydrorhamnose 3,5-epimerase n=1 Tax=Rhodoferax sp. WC2427 TaxID=3234144 RepID=UPI0034675065
MLEVATPRFHFQPTPLAGLWLAQRQPIRDARGFFARFYCAQEFAAIGVVQPLAQINHSFSHQPGTLRGLHFQHPPHAETKVVSCLSGRIFDVAVDLRSGSPTFLQWFGVELSAQAQNSLVIPPGFAHGFQTLEPDSEILYLVTTAYSAEFEDGLHPLDPALAIDWPLPVAEISARDAQRPLLDVATYAGVPHV